jgi:hypothetical protein
MGHPQIFVRAKGGPPAAEVISYIHRNPVKRGLVAKPEDWAWSSYRHYAIEEKGTVEIESAWTAFERGNQLPDGVRLQRGDRLSFPTQNAKDAF